MELDLNAKRNIAWAVNAIRPDWPRHSIITFLDRLEGRDARDVAAALAWIAIDPATDKPGRVLGPGPWWPARDQPTPARRYVTARPAPRDAVTGENLATRIQQARQALKTPSQPREVAISGPNSPNPDPCTRNENEARKTAHSTAEERA